jgi:hypothetical protein
LITLRSSFFCAQHRPDEALVSSTLSPLELDVVYALDQLDSTPQTRGHFLSPFRSGDRSEAGEAVRDAKL